MEGVPDRIREMRTGRSWSQQELAVRAGLSVSGVAKIENGRLSPRMDTLVSIAKAFGVPLRDLLDPAAPLLPVAA